MKDIDIEFVKCVLCSKDNTTLFHQKNSYRIVKCTNCGLIYVNPRLKEEMYTKLYEKNKSSPIDYYIATKECDEIEFEERLEIVETYKKPGRLLDVGCNIGTFMSIAKHKGWEVYGIEINDAATRFCREKLGLNVITGILEDCKFENNFFDLVNMSDVIEHMFNPLNSLKIVYNLLKDDGLIMITTPNIDSWMARHFQIKPTEHLYYFTRITLERILYEASFEVLLCKPINRKRVLNKLYLGSTFTQSKILFRLFKAIDRLLKTKNIIINLHARDDLLAIGKKSP